MATKLEGQIARHEARLEQLRAEKRQADARQRTTENRRARREDTRRKILVGAIVLAKVEQGVLTEDTLRGWLDGALTREDDRALFPFLRPPEESNGSSA